MIKCLLSACLLLAGFGHVTDVAAQGTVPAPYYGWSRITNAAVSAATGPTAGQCLDVPRESKVPGTLVAMHACHGKPNQQFRLKDNAHDATRIAVYEGADERCLGYGPSGDFTKVTIDRCDIAPTWRIGTSGIHPTANPMACLAVDPLHGFLTAELCKNRDWNWFGHNWGLSQLPRIGGPRPLTSVANNRCVAADGGSTLPGTSLRHQPCGGVAAQWFQVVRPDWLPPNMVVVGVYQSGQQLCLSNVPRAGVDAAEAVPCNPVDPRQVWLLPDPADTVTVTTSLVNWETKRCLTAYGGTSTYVGTQPCRGGIDQQWRL